jgi:hypothetical protein
MSPTRSSPRRWPCPAVVLCALGLLGAAAPGDEGRRPAAKREAKRVARMVDALANRNKPPKIVRRRVTPDVWPQTVPLYPEGYDWKEERRVHRALDALLADRTPELWEELLRRWDDERYCVVVMYGSFDNALVYSVGTVCSHLAHDRLVDVFDRHLPPNSEGRPLRLDVVGDTVRDLAGWRKKRAKKSLYELQVEVCQAALRELAKVEGLSKEERAKAREKIEAEVARLKRTKRPDLPKFSALWLKTYNAKDAKRVREAVEDGFRGDIELSGARCR